MTAPAPMPPAIVLGGQAGAVSAARALARHGVTVYGLGRRDQPLRWSRHCRWIPQPEDAEPEDWAELLLESETLHGAVLLACDDEALDLVTARGDALGACYRLEETPAPLRRALRNTLATCRLAEQAGIPTPGFWVAGSTAEASRLLDEVRFPVLVKPQYAPDAARLGARRRRAEDPAEMMQALREAQLRDVPVVIVEFIEGPDRDTSGYHAYLDEDGRPLFEFTMTQPRRHPANAGSATYHVAAWLPETATLGLRFLQAIGLRGLGGVEFKRDARDGRLKLVGCTACLPPANELLVRAGIDAATLGYRRAIGQLPPPLPRQDGERRLIFPYEDFAAFGHSRQAGQPPWSDWWHCLRHADGLPYFTWTDPGPSLAVALGKVSRLWSWNRSVPASARASV